MPVIRIFLPARKPIVTLKVARDGEREDARSEERRYDADHAARDPVVDDPGRRVERAELTRVQHDGLAFDARGPGQRESRDPLRQRRRALFP